MKLAAYIISYLGKGKVRETRLVHHNKQIDWLLKNKSDLDINILAQHYEEGEYRTESNIHYTIIPKDHDILRPGPARNVLLEEYYDSDYDMCIFLDNDSILYDTKDHHMEGGKIFESLEKIWDDDLMQDHVDLFTPIVPRWEPFTKMYKENKELIDSALVFKRTGILKTSLWFFKNVAKHKDMKLFFDESFDEIEDGEFIMAAVAAGLGTYKCMNIVLNEFSGGPENSTLFSEEDGTNSRLDNSGFYKQKIIEKYASQGMTANKKGNIHRSYFFKKCFLHPKYVEIFKNKNERGGLNEFM